MTLKDILANPLVKTALPLVVTTVGPLIETAIQHPSGGLATTLASNPYAALAYAGLGILVHNLISKYAPPTTVETKPAAKVLP